MSVPPRRQYLPIPKTLRSASTAEDRFKFIIERRNKAPFGVSLWLHCPAYHLKTIEALFASIPLVERPIIAADGGDIVIIHNWPLYPDNRPWLPELVAALSELGIMTAADSPRSSPAVPV